MLDLMIMFVQQRCAEGNGEMKKAGGARVFSRDLVTGLNYCTDRPWLVLRRGKAVTETWLSQQLRPYGIRPKTIWIGETSAKGYVEEDFTEVFRRYIPKSALQSLIDESKAANREKDMGGPGKE